MNFLNNNIICLKIDFFKDLSHLLDLFLTLYKISLNSWSNEGLILKVVDFTLNNFQFCLVNCLIFLWFEHVWYY